MESIFDIGMYDASDTAYYLEMGYRVIAVEANPQLVEKAGKRFKTQIASGQLVCVNAAVTEKGEPVDLTLSGADLGSSTLFAERVANRQPAGSVRVPGVTMKTLFEEYGVPKYMKVDIEGADRFAVLPLDKHRRPEFLSFEVGSDVDELLSHVAGLGYRKFKLINQNSFREFCNVNCLYDRITRRLMRYMGYAEPQLIRRAGRLFVTDHSSGPVPWLSDGKWRTLADLQSVIRNRKLPGWNDIHAALE